MSAAAPLRLATRGSRLALAQAHLVVRGLQLLGIPAELVVITTRGDALTESAGPAGVEGEGWFTTELERALVEGRADAAVHSAKDLPTEIVDGLEIVALPARGDPSDAVVTRDGRRLADLPAGATVGTASPRRTALIGALHPALTVVPMRGNVDTRLRRLDEGQVDAVVVAAAGLDRLGCAARIAERLDPRRFVPAPAQGALAIESRLGSEVAGRLRALDDPATATAVTAERAVLRHLGGGCLLPLGAWARREGDRLLLTAALVEDGELRTADVVGAPDDPSALGALAAARLR